MLSLSKEKTDLCPDFCNQRFWKSITTTTTTTTLLSEPRYIMAVTVWPREVYGWVERFRRGDGALMMVRVACRLPPHVLRVGSRYISVSGTTVVSALMKTGRSRFEFRRRRNYFSSSLCVQTGSGPHPASCTMGTGAPFPGGKARSGRDADHSPSSSAEVVNE
jgi:hypothetical protein